MKYWLSCILLTLFYSGLLAGVQVRTINVGIDNPPTNVPLNQEIQINDLSTWDFVDPRKEGKSLSRLKSICFADFTWTVIGPDATITSAPTLNYHFNTYGVTPLGSVHPLTVIFNQPGVYTIQLALMNSGCNFVEPPSITMRSVTINAASASVVPTLSEWGIFILILVLLVVGSLAVRQRKVSTAM